jgi:hypothetical protein
MSVQSFTAEKLFGNETIRTFRETHLYDYLELEREFEMAKRKVKIDDNSKITIRIPVSFLEVFRAVNDCTDITEYIDSTTYRRQVSVVRDKLKMEAGIIQEMFRPKHYLHSLLPTPRRSLFGVL